MPGYKNATYYLQKETRRAHRTMLRAANRDDQQEVRYLLHDLYNPDKSPLTQLSDGPEKHMLVPLVDMALLTAYKGRSLAPEMLDNLQSVGHSFGMSSEDMAHVGDAVAAAQAAGMGDRSALDEMGRSLEAAGFGCESGTCMPAAMAERALP